MKSNPLSICEDEIYWCKYVSLDPTDRKTLCKYIVKLADIVGLKIKEKIGKGNCISDGLSCSGVHYIAVYHRWPHRGLFGEIEVLTALLAIQPLLDESNLGSASLAEFIIATYEMYDDNMRIEDEDNGLDSVALVCTFTLG